MRVVGGRLRGRTLTAPKNHDVRPTSDRVRESLFNILEHRTGGPSLDGARVIDLFSGTGAIGIEALSRGAKFCLFVEQAPESRALIRANVEAFALTGVSKIFRRDATDLGPIGTMAPFDFAFLDPPYGQALGESALTALRSGGWLSADAMVILEERVTSEIGYVTGFECTDMRTYGDTQIRLYRLDDA